LGFDKEHEQSSGSNRLVETVYRMNIPASVALLGDLHGRPWQAVVGSLQKHKPEIICIAGDVLYGRHPTDDQSPLIAQTNVLPFLEACGALAPTFMSLGNHEWMLDDEDIRQIQSTGVTVLDNGWTDHHGLVIGGLSSAYATEYHSYRDSLGALDGVRYPAKMTRESGSALKPDTAWLSEFCAVPGFHVLLCHHPEYYPLIPEGVQLILSAHAHGGQWRVFGRGVFAPGQGWWPKWTKGVYDNRMIVSAGLANTTRAPRIFNPTEVVYVEAGK
jgi:hypothetical protein